MNCQECQLVVSDYFLLRKNQIAEILTILNKKNT